MALAATAVPQAAVAPTAVAVQQPAPKASEEIREVMKDPEFGRKGTRTRVRYVGPEFEGKRDAKPFDWSWLAKLTQWMSEISRAAAWVAAALALAFVLYYLARYLRLHRFANLAQRRPDFLFGLDVRPESLPDDVAGRPRPSRASRGCARRCRCSTAARWCGSWTRASSSATATRRATACATSRPRSVPHARLISAASWTRGSRLPTATT
jgi:hypothetical protein